MTAQNFRFSNLYCLVWTPASYVPIGGIGTAGTANMKSLIYPKLDVTYLLFIYMCCLFVCLHLTKLATVFVSLFVYLIDPHLT